MAPHTSVALDLELVFPGAAAPPDPPLRAHSAVLCLASPLLAAAIELLPANPEGTRTLVMGTAEDAEDPELWRMVLDAVHPSAATRWAVNNVSTRCLFAAPLV